jgi:CrcB protein
MKPDWCSLLHLLVTAPRRLPEGFQSPVIRNPLAISLGAIAGALSRYYITQWLLTRWGGGFPYGTLVVNLTGAWLMGLLVTLTLQRVLVLAPEVNLMLAVGFLGSYTTFSTYALDVVGLLQAQKFWLAFLYWFGSAIAGAICLYGGILTGRWLAIQ